MRNNLFLGVVAARKAGIEGWEPYKFEKIGSDAVAVTGGIPRLLTRGPRKGRKTWDGKGTTEVVTSVEMELEFKRYEADTGKCGDCLGERRVYAGWHHIEGTRYRPCKRCGESGKAP